MLTRHPNPGELPTEPEPARAGNTIQCRGALGVTCAHPSEVGALQPKSAGAASTSVADHSSGLLIELPDECWHLVVAGTTSSMTDGRCRCSSPSCSPCIGLVVTSPLAAPRPYRDYIGWLAGRDQTATQCGRINLNGLDGPGFLLSPALADTPTGIPGRTEVP